METSNESKQIDPSEIVFNDQWAVWYHHELNIWTIDGYRKIYTIKTMKDFWEFFNNFECLGGVNKLHYFIMRNGITPIYEDVRNKNGGSWSSLVPLSNAEESFTNLAISTIGETLTSKMQNITGISANVKSGVSVIKIWNNNKQDTNLNQLNNINTILKHKQGQIIYRPHPKS